MHDDWIKYCFGSVREIHIALVYGEVYGQLKLKFEKISKKYFDEFSRISQYGSKLRTWLLHDASQA